MYMQNRNRFTMQKHSYYQRRVGRGEEQSRTIINSRYKLPCIKKQAPIIYCIAGVIIAIILQ